LWVVHETGSKKGIQPDHATKLGRMLDRLDASTDPQDMNLPGYRLHPLKGDREDFVEIGTAFETDHRVSRHKLGQAELKLMKQRELVDFAVEWIEKNRE